MAAPDRWPARVHPRIRPVVAGVLALLAGAAWGQTAESSALPPPSLSEPLQLQATPLLSEQVPPNPNPPAFVSGDRYSGRTGLEATLEGAAELRRPGMTLHSDQLVYDQSTDIATVSGGVRLNAKGDRYSATQGQLQVDAFEGFLLQPSYDFLQTQAYGNADRMEFLDRDRTLVYAGSYTTCRREEGDWRPDWILVADRIDIDREADEGRAEGAVLHFKGVPVLASPNFSFPISARRKSGWLPPTVGLDNKSGLNLSVPHYWNIAPNRDATFTPAVMVRRGVEMGGEFRYLENNYRGRVEGYYMPSDRLRDRDRWSYFVRHDGTLPTGVDSIGALGLHLNLNRVSDDNYWSDFSHKGLSSSDRLLANDASLDWARGDFALTARTLKWQTLQDVTSPIVPPYDRLPQIVGRWGREHDRGFDYSIETDYTRFRGDRMLTLQPNAERAYMLAQVARPFTRPWGFFVPRLQMHATTYSFDDALSNGHRSANRALPTGSLDGGLIFERAASYFGRGFTQTLEPRLMYVYTPYREQNHLPNYDSGLYDFNFATIWSTNLFAGNDRIVDNNLITGGLTTRLLDPETGAEAVRLGIAQRYRFSDQSVVLPGDTPTGQGWSDIMLGASINWDPRWSFDSVVQYNPDTDRSARHTLHMRYSPGPYRTVSAAYRYQRDVDSESIDIGWQWPLSHLWSGRKELGTTRARGSGGRCNGTGWYSVGRLNYSMSDNRMADAIIGFEYDAGCWIGRMVYEQEQHSLSSSSTKRVMFQIELRGLSRVGSNPLSTLRDSIPRYQNLPPDLPAPSRFTTYD
ncbi:LPS-assembly protein LptD [Ottowia sp.]|uniref:LPS-assembly protein LptD n=1 Tax=Ottowia sp. TaxID=1898956 RepID=UPI003A843085